MAVEHLTVWPIAMPTKDGTAKTVIDFMKKEIIDSFSPPRFVFSNNASYFLVDFIEEVMNQFGILWTPVFVYTPMGNGKAEHMIGALKTSVTRLATNKILNWDEASPKAVYGYRRRKGSSGFFPFELSFGHPPTVTQLNLVLSGAPDMRSTVVQKT